MTYKNKKSIAILLATYNGAKYLELQLQSLLWQTCQNFTVYVHDDCSTDGTNALLLQYVEKYPEKFIIVNDDITVGRGARDSFFYLLENVDSQYYMFCDQDDVWLPSKVELSYERMKVEENETPNTALMVYSDLLLVDENTIPLGETLWERAKMKSTWYDTIYANYVWLGRYWGCTILINERTKKIALPWDTRAYGHDIWLGLMVNMSHGRCIPMDICTILYRQHSFNTSGGVPSFSGNKYYSKHLKRIFHFYDTNKQMYELSHEIVGCSVWEFLKAKLYLIISRFF